MKKFILLLYYYALKIWSNLKLIFFAPAVVILLIYCVCTIKGIIKKMMSGEMEEALKIMDVMDFDTGEWSLKTKHTANIFWLTILVLIVIF